MKQSGTDVSRLLRAWGAGDRQALDDLVPLVYSELQRLARHYLRQRRTGDSLQTTVLINEAFVKLIGNEPMGWENRAHFFGIAARTMRDVLVEHAI